MVSEGQESGSGLTGWFWLSIYPKASVKPGARTTVSGDLTGPGGCTSKLTQLLARGLGPYHVGLSIGMFMT